MANTPVFNLDELREKYNDKLFTIGTAIEVDDFTTERLSYIFRKPPVPSYDRLIKNLSNSPSASSKTFVLDNVIEEQREQLRADLEEYPAMAQTFTDKLTAMLGLAKETNVKKFSTTVSPI